MYNVEESVSVQHELFPRVSVTAGWFHRDYKHLFRRTNTLQTFADYTPFTLFSPIDGSAITYYNVSAAKRSAVSTIDENASGDRRMWFNGLDTVSTRGCRTALRCSAAAPASGPSLRSATRRRTLTCCCIATRP